MTKQPLELTEQGEAVDTRPRRVAEPEEVVASDSTEVIAHTRAETSATVRPELLDERASDHRGLPRFMMVAVTVAAIGLSLAFVRDLRDIITPIFFGLNLMITAYPLHKKLVSWKVPKGLSATIAGFVVFLVLIGFFAGLSWSVAAMVTKLPDYNAQFMKLYEDGIALLARFGYSEDWLVEQAKAINPQSVVNVLGSVVNSTSGVLSMLVVIVTAMIFMVMDTPDMGARMAVARQSHGRFIGALEHFCEGIRKYWIVTTVFGLIVAVLDLAVLLGLGVPLALVWALFSFLTNYIPNVGFVIGVIPPALLALFDKGPKTAIAVVVAYSVLNFVVQSIIQPKIAGNAVGLGPTLSFISLLLWTSVLGPLGALLALPSSLLVKALLIDADPKARWANALISSRIEDADLPVATDEPEPATT
ncbi:AI-2E family transporter [Aestuariimicrobium soli]|uniref:AI-2E family transporter n=1 Tax=Aestuariimicrobium soli TaxID=2035834 RepID=UPI003EB80482